MKINLSGRDITSITDQSQKVLPGGVFVAVRGTAVDGHEFIEEAVRKGAAVIVGEEDNPKGLGQTPYIQVKDSRQELARLANLFYGSLSSKFQLIGITGTSGKTTTAFLTQYLLSALGKKTGLMGTIETRFGQEREDSSLTTQGPLSLHALLKKWSQSGCEAVAMEVSSHALTQKRTDYLAFDAMVFTNLSHEHLDFHRSMDDYFAAKKRLFFDYVEYSLLAKKKPVLCIATDDSYGAQLYDRVKALYSSRSEVKILSFGIEKKADLYASKISTSIDGTEGLIHYAGLQQRFGSSLIGGFNVYNLLAAYAVGVGLGYSSQKILSALEKFPGVPGRMEVVKTQNHKTVIVDYCHKPNALESVLLTLRELLKDPGSALVCVVGCGGDRDKSKRPMMADIACRLSDRVIFTSDNPRTEDPQKIIQDMLQGTHGRKNFEVQSDREKAIRRAIELSSPDDIVLVAGKGHEKYQIVGTEKLPFDDAQVVRLTLDP